MLYDKKWDAKAKPDVFSLDGLIAWLEKQPAKTRYDWTDCGGDCLIGHYFIAMGLGKDRPHHYHRVFYQERPENEHDGSYSRVCGVRPFTYGAALSRARKIAETR
jgi:hypothetical protein